MCNVHTATNCTEFFRVTLGFEKKILIENPVQNFIPRSEDKIFQFLYWFESYEGDFSIGFSFTDEFAAMNGMDQNLKKYHESIDNEIFWFFKDKNYTEFHSCRVGTIKFIVTKQLYHFVLA